MRWLIVGAADSISEDANARANGSSSDKGIPVFIGSSLEPDAGGTLIKPGVFSDGFVGIAVIEKDGLFKTTVVGRFGDELLKDFSSFIKSKRPLSTTLELDLDNFNKLTQSLLPTR